MAVLSSMVLFALSASTESAKAAKTQTTINKLNAIIMAKYESYRTRRVPVDLKAVTAYYQTLGSNDQFKRAISPSVKSTIAMATARLDAIRDLMRLEMPDGFADLVDINGNPLSPITAWGNTSAMTMATPAATKAYQAILKKHGLKADSKVPQQAECLYLIVTRGCDDPDVLEQFSPSEIADTDGDGIPEFVDGWGRPIFFLRWAPAYISTLQPDPTTVTQHDPFDPLNVSAITRPDSKTTYPLYPLIYSAGPDGVYDLKVDIGGAIVYYQNFTNDPFSNKSPNQIATYIGQRDADNDGNDQSVDNITNHDIGENP